MSELQQAWSSVLTQLQMDMPRASFETWVLGTVALGLENDVLLVSTRNAYARDWLESRLTSTVQRLLVGILNRSVSVKFVVGDESQEEMETEAEETDEPELNIEPVQWLDYDRIVQPHKQVVVKGYLRRLGMEIGPKVVWLYVGFHQAAWRVQDQNNPSGKPLHSHEVKRFSAMSNGAFWRLLKHTGIQGHLTGLVQRVDSQDARRFRRGRDGRPHRAPIRYQVFMTPRLTRADATAVHLRLKALIEKHNSITSALQEMLAVEDVMELLEPMDVKLPHAPVNTVMDMARLETGEKFSGEIERLAQELHRRIINCLGDIHIPHYFITETIHRYNLTPAQAWLITVARDMAFINARTGERRDTVTFKQGYQEMAELIGSNRYKTVQAWLHLHWTSQQRGGNLSRFLQEIELPDSKTYADLRVESMPRAFRVLLDEPLDADGSNKVDANGSHMADADGSISWTQMGALADANGSHMVDANGSDLNSFKHSLNTDKKNTSTTHPLKGTGHAQSAKAAEAVAPDFWELEFLLQQNDVHPKVQKELLEVQASVHAFVSWVLYVASPGSGNLSDPLGYAISRLREHPLHEARGVFRQLADLPPAELLMLIDTTPTRAYELPTKIEHPLAHAWKKAMGSNNPRLLVVREILFGEGASE
jgi:hypothetical protein